MTPDYDISLATANDIPGILVLQEPNLPENGGSLSVRLTADWFKSAILENQSWRVGATAKLSAMSWGRLWL
jgi:hypothetical protein